MKKATFILQLAVQNGVEGYIVKGWENVLGLSELPKQYLETYPLFFKTEGFTVNSGKNIIMIFPRKDSTCFFTIKRGDFIAKKTWEETFYYLMRQAGHRFSEILKEERKIIRVEI